MKLIHSPTDPLVQSQLCFACLTPRCIPSMHNLNVSLVTCPATRRVCDGNWLLQY